MSKHDMESMLRRKFDGFEPPHGDRWSQIEAALPKKKKRRAIVWLWMGAALLGAGSLWFSMPKNSEVTFAESTHTGPARGAQANPESNEPIDAEKGNNISAETPTDQPNSMTGHHRMSPSDILPEGESAVYQYSVSNWGEILPQVEEEREGEIEEEGEVETERETETETERERETETETERVRERQPAVQPSKSKEPKQFTPVWSAGIGVSASLSWFKPVMPEMGNPANHPSASPDLIAENHALRSKIEKTGFSFSQGLYLNYRFHPNLSLGSGLSMVQSTQILRFNLSNQNINNVNGSGHYKEYKPIGPGEVYLYDHDTISEGNGYQANNKYFAREIPLTLNAHFKLSKKLELSLSTGISYRWVRSASVYLPNTNNVGMTYLNGPSAYPGIRNTWHLQGGIGLNYQVGDYFNLEVHPTVSYALQSNIRQRTVVQQFQRQCGLQFRFTRRLN